MLEAGENPQLLAFSGGGDRAEEGWQTEVRVSRGINQNVVAAASVDPAAPAGGDVTATTLPLTVDTSPAPAPGENEEAADQQVRVEVGEPRYTDLDAAEDIASAQGFLMSWRADSNGAVSTLRLLAPENSTERGRQVVESSLLTLISTNVVLPEQPVGVGGTWTVRNRITGDAAMQRTTTYKVTDVQGQTVTLDVKVAEEPSDSSVSIDNEVAGALNGQTLNVESAETTSEGSIVVDLARPVPVRGHVNATTRVVFAGPQADNRVVQDITTAVDYGD